MEDRGDAFPLPPPPPPPVTVPQPPPPPPVRPLGRYAAIVAGLSPVPGLAAAPPVVPEAVLAIPPGIRGLLRRSLDLLTRRDTGLRGASFYIGFLLLVTVWPLAVIFALLLTLPGLAEPAAFSGADAFAGSEAAAGWMLLAAAIALPGYLAAATEARSMACAVIGGRVEGRPLVLRESIAVARMRFWPMLGAQLLIGTITGIVSAVVQLGMFLTVGPAAELTFGISLVVSVILSTPFVYVAAGIVLGEVGIFDAIARSWRLVRLRLRLALVVTLFSVLGQFIVLFGLSSGLDVVARVLVGTGIVDAFPRPLLVPVAATLVFALGTLTFLVEAIAAAPAVHAFAAMTHYTHGLQGGRDRPLAGTSLFIPWVTPGLAVGAVVGLLALLGAIASLPA